MAQLRLIGEPDEVNQIAALLGAVVDVADLSPGRSRRNPAHILLYGSVRLRQTVAPPTVTVVQVHDGPELDGGQPALPRGPRK